MKKVGSPRLALWMIILVLLLGVAYVYYFGDNQQAAPIKTVSQATIMGDFRAMKDVEVPAAPALGGKFFATELLFPADFKGQTGETFFVRMEDGHIAITVSYRIQELTDEIPTQATYQPIKEHGPDYVPTGEYAVKSLSGQTIENGAGE